MLGKKLILERTEGVSIHWWFLIRKPDRTLWVEHCWQATVEAEIVCETLTDDQFTGANADAEVGRLLAAARDPF